MTSADVALYKKRTWLLVGIIVVDDKYRGKADEICKRLNLDTTPSLWFGRKDNKKVPLLDEWLKI